MQDHQKENFQIHPRQEFLNPGGERRRNRYCISWKLSKRPQERVLIHFRLARASIHMISLSIKQFVRCINNNPLAECISGGQMGLQSDITRNGGFASGLGKAQCEELEIDDLLHLKQNCFDYLRCAVNFSIQFYYGQLQAVIIAWSGHRS